MLNHPALNEPPTGRRAATVSAIAAMPPSSNAIRRRLERVTLAFLESQHFADACRFNWSDDELYAVHIVAPAIRVEAMGLVSWLALSKLAGPRLEAIRADCATTRCASGSLLTTPRARPGDRLGVPWWHCSILHEPKLPDVLPT